MNTTLERTLEQVDGYLEFGMPEDTAWVFDELSARMQIHPEVAAARTEVLLAAGNWKEAASMAQGLTDFMEDVPEYWIWWACATRRSESAAATEDILADALDLHSSVAGVHYKLACCAAARGRLNEARARLREAVGLDPHIAVLAAADPDLEILRRDKAQLSRLSSAV